MSSFINAEIKYTQILDENGKLLDPCPLFTDDHKKLLHLYRIMVLIRAFDKKAIALQRTGKMGTYAPINGQEAISTAIGAVMEHDDVLIPYYRDYAAQIQRGVKMSEILAYWGGDERGNDFCANNHDLPMCVPIASQCLHAAGVAFACKYRAQSKVAVVSLGDGGTSEGDFYEAMNLAGVWELPLVMIINNNQWAISVPIKKQTHCQTLAQKAVAAGFTGQQVDGNDILGCCTIINEALAKARSGGGPTLIEAISYRLSDHTTADDASRYQPSAEVKQAIIKEPIIRFKCFLESQQLWDDSLEEQLQSDVNTQITQTVDEYLSRPKQHISSMFDYHYATLPNYLIEQRATAIEEAANG